MFEPEPQHHATQQQSAHTQPTVSASAASASASAYPFRLLEDERVLATYLITDKSRPLGKLVSYLFVTDSRVIYAAESKSIISSSTETKTFRLEKVDGIDAGRHRGLNALGGGIAVAIVLNLLFLVSTGALLVSFAGQYGVYTGSNDLAGGIAGFFTFATVVTIVIGVVVVANLARPTGHLAINAQASVPWSLAQQHDWLTIGTAVFLFLLFGPLVGIALLAWIGVRAVGIFQAKDAFIYSDTANLDAIAYDAGAVILDAQARGSFAGS